MNSAARKVKVAVGKSKGLSGGVLTLEPKNRNADGARGIVKVATRKSKGSSDDVSTLLKDDKPKGRARDANVISKGSSDDGRMLMPIRKGTAKQQSRVNSYDTVSYGNRIEKSTKSVTWGKKDLKTNSGEEWKSGRERNRTYTDRGIAEGRVYEGNGRNFNRKSNFKVEKTVDDSYFDKGENRKRGKSDDVEGSGKYKSLPGSRKFRGTESLHKRSDKLNHTHKNVLGNRMSKTIDKLKVPLIAKTERRKFAIDSAEKPRRNKVQIRKSLTTDSELMEYPPKKKKRVIRLDPHDISNKRLDDDRANNDNSQRNKDSTEASEGEISKNAQFRAIIPSYSILSFVEDNLLGRRREIEFRRAGYNIELPSPLDNLPLSTNSERERIEVPVFRNKLEFYAAAKISSSFPAPDLPEIAFAGRSNVGKSSLLNSLTRQWGVVRTSDKPGLTQTINFFKLGPKLSLVDLPGYGFAYAKDEVKESWEELVKEYVASRVGLKRVCLLVDTKWGLKPRDHELIELMERSQTKYQIVLTKTDLVFPMDVARRAMQIEENLKAKKSAVQPLMMVSSKTGAGVRCLRTALANIVKFAKR